MASMTDGRRIMISAVISLATMMQALDSTIANVALPYMQGSLSASQDQSSWVITSYVIATAIMTVVSGYLGDRFGRKRIFVISIVGFTISSVLCGASQSLPQMVVFRLLQGISAASVVPLSQSMMVAIWPKEKLGIAMSMWGMGVMLAPILGPSLGGYLTDVLNWRWVFLVNVPIGILCTIGLIVLVPSSPPDENKKLNALGFAYFAIAVATLQLVLDRGQLLDWFDSREIVIETVVGAVCFFLFLVDMFTSDDPFIHPAIFRDLNYVTANLLCLLQGLLMLSCMALWPNMLQLLMGYPVGMAGLLMVPRGIGGMLAIFLAGRGMALFGYRPLIVGGLILVAFSQWLSASITLDVGTSWLVWIVFLNGVGIGIYTVPISTMCFETLDRRYVTQASVCYALARNVGVSVGVSVMVAVVSHYTAVNHAIFSELVGLFSAGLRHFAASAMTGSGLSPEIAGMVEGEISRQASITAYCNAYMFMLYGLLALVPIVMLKRPGKPLVPLASPIAHEM